MMRRTPTTHLTTFVRPTATMNFSSPPGSSPITTITIPPGSAWSSGLHWHETHVEYLRVVRGTAWVHLSGAASVLSASDGPVTVPRFARHEWRRATRAEMVGAYGSGADATAVVQDADEDEPLVVEEWTDPFDGQKEVFFRNVNSVILDTTAPGNAMGWATEPWLMLQLFLVFRQCDNWPVFWSAFGVERLQWFTTHLLLQFAGVIGSVLGMTGLWDEYTPVELILKQR